jgi:hypothetical protein
MVGVRFLAKGKSFFLLHSVQTDSGAHSAFYLMGIGGSFQGTKAAQGVKLTTYLCLVPRSRMVELYIHFPIRLHGVVLNYLSTGTTLIFTFTIF